MTPPLSPGIIGGPAAWKGPALQTRPDWIKHFSNQELDELKLAVRVHQDSGRDMGAINATTFKLPTLAPTLALIKQELLQGRGFVVMRGLDVASLTIEEAAIAYLGLGAHLGSFRSQNAKGHLLGHVRDLGLNIKNPNVRYYQTNRALDYHTDSCDVVGLLCLRAAKTGGYSRLVSSVSLHDAFFERRPALWRALFNAFPTDRRGEIPPGMQPWFDMPIFHWFEGQLTTIYVGQYIRSAQALFPQARRLTDLELEAIAVLDQWADDDEFALGMEFLPGDIQFVHNHQILHSRTDFENWPEPERQRHLFRLWLAPPQARRLPPVFASRYGSLEAGARGGIITQSTTLTFSLVP